MIQENLSTPVNPDGVAQIMADHDPFDTLESVMLHGEQAASVVECESMKRVLERLRLQIKLMIGVIRSWHGRHDMCEDNISARYSAYEGTMFYNDLRRHWALYRFAMREYMEVRVASISPLPHLKRVA